MPKRIEDRVRPITPQLAWRVAVLGGIAFVLFGIVFFRLWYLQVLSGQDYVVQASENRLRKEPIEAPRGDIVDRHGETLVETKRAAVVQIEPSSLPETVLDQADQYRKELAAAENERLKAADRYDAYARQLRDDGRKNTKANAASAASSRRSRARAQGRRSRRRPQPSSRSTGSTAAWARCSTIRPSTIHERVIRGIADTPFSNVTIRTDVRPPSSSTCASARSTSPASRSRGATCASTRTTSSPRSCSARSPRSPRSSASDKKFAGIEQGTRIGQSGLEETYDKYLRGVDGYSRVVVDAFGSRDEERRLSVRDPKQGQRLKLTLDYDLQRAGDAALSKAISASRARRQGRRVHRDGPARRRDPRHGLAARLRRQRVRAPFSQRTWENLTSQATGAPLINRVTESAYPTGSVFKPITALAALESGAIGPTADDQRHRQVRARPAGGPERQGRDLRHDQPRAGADGVLGRVLLPPRRADGREGAGAAEVGQAPRVRARHRDRPLGRAAGPGPRQQVAQRRLRALQRNASRRPACRRARPPRCTSAAASSAAGARATTSTSPSARVTCRPRRCRSRSPIPRWPTTARSSRRTSARRSRTATASRSRSCAPGRAARSSSTSATARSCSTACAAPPTTRTARPTTSSRASRRYDLRQDGHGGAPAQPRSVVVRVLRQGRRQADRGRRDRRARRLRRGNCGTRGAPHPG